MLILSNKHHTTNSGFLRLESKQELKNRYPSDLVLLIARISYRKFEASILL